MFRIQNQVEIQIRIQIQIALFHHNPPSSSQTIPLYPTLPWPPIYEQQKIRKNPS